MKKTFFFIAAILITAVIKAQTNPVDDIFNRYSEKEGFTSVYISGRMLSMLAGLETKEGNPDNILRRIKSIRILTENDSLAIPKVDLYIELSKKLDMSVYEELMVVKEGREVTKFLILEKDNIISELLVISGGDDGNALISIRGDLNLKEIAQLSNTIGIEELEQLEKVEDKKPGK